MPKAPSVHSLDPRLIR